MKTSQTIQHSFSSTNDELKYKLIMVGDSNVGKSSLFMRFIYGDSFAQQQIVTNVTTIDFNTKDVYLPEERQSVKLFIWDTAGQQRYRCIVSTYFKGCHGVLLVFDLSQPKSFQNVKSQWLPQIRKKAQDASIILIGNKSDLQQRVSEQQIDKFCRQNKLPYIRTSTKSNKNIKQAFYKLTRIVNTKRDMYQRRVSFAINNKNNQYGSSNSKDSNSKLKSKKRRNCCRQQ